MKERVCKNCGGKEYKVVGQNMVKCLYCGTLYVDEQASKEEEVLSVNAQVLTRELKFDEALEQYDKILELFPLSFESYYGRCLCRNKIVFYGNKSKLRPRFFGNEIPSIKDDPDFLEAIKIAPPERAKTFNDQAKRIEKIHNLYQDVKKEKIDIVVCDPGYNQNNKYVQEAIDNFEKSGYSVYFLQDLKGMEKEEDTFLALSTCKVFLLFVNDKINYNLPEFKNLYDRYYYFASQKKKSWTGFIIAIDKNVTKMTNLPKDLQTYKTVIDINGETFSQDLQMVVSREMKISVDEYAKIDTINLKKESPEKKKEINIKSVQPVELGSYHVDNVSLTSKNKIKWVFLCLKNGDFVSAEEVINEELEKDKNNAELLFAKLMLSKKIKTEEEFFSTLENFKDSQSIEEILNCANKTFAENFVEKWENLIIKIDDVDVFNQYLLFLAKYDTPSREMFIQKAEEKSVESLNKDLIDKVCMCFDAKDVDRFINFWFALAQKSGDQEYFNKILDIDPSHEQSNISLLLSNFKTDEEKLSFRDKETVEGTFKYLSSKARFQCVSTIVSQILPIAFKDLKQTESQLDFYLSYVEEEDDLFELLIKIAKEFQQMRFFKLAEKYCSIAISKRKTAELFWLLISIKAHCTNDAELVMSTVKVTQMPEWESLLSVASEEESEKYASLASKINLYEGKKREIEEGLKGKSYMISKLKDFLLRNNKILLDMKKQDENMRKGAKYYELQLKPFESYIEKLKNAQNFQEYNDIISKINQRLNLLGLSLDSSINVTHLLSREDGLKVVYEATEKSNKQYEKSKTSIKANQFLHRFLFGFLELFPMLFCTLLLFVSLIEPKQVYLFFSQDFLVICVMFSVIVAAGNMIYFAIMKKRSTKFSKIANWALLCVGALNVILLAFFSPKTMIISNAKEFNILVHNARSASFELSKDIDLSSIKWKQFNFLGKLDGKGHELSNVNLYGDSFIKANSGEILNLTINFGDEENFSCLIKQNDGKLENVTVLGNFSLKPSSNANISVFTQKNNGEISKCSADVTFEIETSHDLTFGGLACETNSGKIEKNELNLTVNLTQNDGKLTFGGLVGTLNSSNGFSKNSVNLNAMLSGQSGEAYIGGIIGRAYNEGSNSFATGKIDIQNLQGKVFAGGLVGLLTNSDRQMTINHCYSLVEIVPGEAKVGSLVGRLEGYINNCISNQNDKFVGQLEGSHVDTPNCYFFESEFDNSKAGFDENVWLFEGNTFPKLK